LRLDFLAKPSRLGFFAKMERVSSKEVKPLRLDFLAKHLRLGFFAKWRGFPQRKSSL
jgi:hypothetical protein